MISMEVICMFCVPLNSGLWLVSTVEYFDCPAGNVRVVFRFI